MYLQDKPTSQNDTERKPDPMGIDVVTEQPPFQKAPTEQKSGGWFNPELAD